MDSYKELVRRVAITTANERHYCDAGLNATLRTLGLPLPRHVRGATVKAQLQPPRPAPTTDPAAAMAHVAIALHRRGLTFTDLQLAQTQGHEAPDLFTAVLEVPVSQRIADDEPDRYERLAITSQVNTEIASIVSPAHPSYSLLRGHVVEILDITLDER